MKVHLCDMVENIGSHGVKFGGEERLWVVVASAALGQHAPKLRRSAFTFTSLAEIVRLLLFKQIQERSNDEKG